MTLADVLIIEDELHIAELERDYLQMSGFTCDIAENLRVGYEKFEQGHYRLVILDLMLPDGSGLDLSKQINEVSDVPIIMVTAKGDDLEKLTGFSHGAIDYIVKPFNPNELVARVRAHIERYDRMKGDDAKKFIVFGQTIIDIEGRTVEVRNHPVSLTAKEFDLLLFLTLNPNRVFTKEELFEKIWGLEAVGDNTTVTVHIRKLREKIERDPAEPEWILTVWGVGYKFKKIN